MEQELKIAAEIQQALLPDAQRKGTFFEAVAQSVPCRSIGGDFFDYVELADAAFGSPWATSRQGRARGPAHRCHPGRIQGLASLGMSPSQTLAGVNQAIIARAIESRFCTAFYAVVTPAGQLAYCHRRAQPADGLHEDRRPSPRQRGPHPRNV